MAGPPARPPTERDLMTFINGDPSQGARGILQSTGVAVNNSTTSTPFYAGTTAVTPTPNYYNTLGGRTLLIQATAAGFWMPASSAAITITTQATPTGFGLIPGIAISSGETRIIVMSPTSGWLQWLPIAAGNLLVWELT